MLTTARRTASELDKPHSESLCLICLGDGQDPEHAWFKVGLVPSASHVPEVASAIDVRIREHRAASKAFEKLFAFRQAMAEEVRSAVTRDNELHIPHEAQVFAQRVLLCRRATMSLLDEVLNELR
jgi:hypothetical protein